MRQKLPGGDLVWPIGHSTHVDQMNTTAFKIFITLERRAYQKNMNFVFYYNQKEALAEWRKKKDF